MSDAFRTVDVPWAGKTLVVRRPSFWTEREFRRHLERQALEFVLDNRELFGSEGEYQDAIRAVSRDAASRTFAWGMPECNRAMLNDENIKHFLFLVLAQPGKDGKAGPQPWLTREEMGKAWDDLAYQLDDGRPGNRLWDAYLDVIRDPNPPAPPGSTGPAAAKN